MAFLDYFGIFISVVLVGGLLWALVDLLWKIHRQPKKEGPIDLTRLSIELRSDPFIDFQP
jgi:hypothetical protein